MNTKYFYPFLAILAASFGFIGAKKWHEYQTETAIKREIQQASTSKRPVLTLPEFSLKNREGTPQSIHSWPGKSLIINFWATWCAPCRQEIPLLMSLQEQYAADGFQLVGIAIDFREDVLKYAEAVKINYPLLIGEQDGLDAVDGFGIEAVGFPYTVFTDAQNNIITTYVGELHKTQAELILNTIKKINIGEIAADEGRAQLKAQLARL
jgi:hypothetical protein